MDFTDGDVRQKTTQSRLDIGFLADYKKWQEEPAQFTDHTLVINGHPVMEDWEDNYMKELADVASRNGGRVLEVGYGMGISATYIQKHELSEHVIIEANKEVFTKLEAFAAQALQKVTPLFGFWQDVLPTLEDESIDGILFDTYPLTEAEIHQNHFDFFAQSYRVLKTGGVLTYYSDEIDTFSDAHIQKLHEAGFTQIDKNICTVTPPEDCQYWKSSTIVVPIITK